MLLLFVLVVAHLVIAAPRDVRHKLQASLVGASKFSSSDTLHSRLTQYAAANRLTIINNKILVEIFLADTGAAFVNHLSTFGITQDQSYGRVNNRLQALVPPEQLNTLARDKRVRWIQSPSVPHRQSTGNVH